MSSCGINITNGKKSILFDQLVEALGSEELADYEMNKIQSKAFTDRFGKWDEMYKNDYKDNPKMQGSEFTNVDGEPVLHESKNQHYIKFPDGTRYSINKVSFGGELTEDQIKEVTTQLLYDYMVKDDMVSFNDFTIFDPKNILPSIESSMENYILANEGDEVAIKSAKTVLKYKNEFAREVENAIESKGFRFKEKLYDAEGNREGYDGENFTEEEKISAVNIKDSMEKNSKDNAVANVKLFLSFIPTVEVFETEDGLDVRPKLGEFLSKKGFVPFDIVWDTLEPLLADIVGHGKGEFVKDPFDLMLVEIGKLSQIHPWAVYLKQRLESIDGPHKDERRAEFFQAFAKSKSNLYVSDVKTPTPPANPLDEGDPHYRYDLINATETNSRFSKVRNEWGENFRKVFLNGAGKIKDIKDVELVQNKLRAARHLFDETYSDEINHGATEDTAEIQAIGRVLEDLVEALNLMSIDITEDHIIIMLEMGDHNASYNMINDIFNGANYLIENELLSDKSFIKDGDYSSPLSTQSFVKTLAEAKAMTQHDGSENTVVGNEGKTYWTYSSPSYLSNIINELKRDPSLLEEASSLVWNKNSRWLSYLMATEKDDEGNFINPTSEKREVLSRERIASLQLALASSFKTTNGSFDNKSIEITDAFNDNLHKVLGDKFGDKSLFSTITAADKSRKIELVGFKSFDSAIDYNEEMGWYIHEDTVDVFVDYFEDEYNRMKLVSQEIKTLPESKLVKHYHTGAKNGLKSQLFPDFSHDSKNLPQDLKDALYTKGEPSVTSLKGLTDDQRELLKGYIKKDIESRLEEAKNELTRLGVFKDVQGKLVPVAADFRLERYYEGNTSPAHAMIGDYLVNGLISSVEYGKLFSGDPAYYKNGEDLIKRVPATYTDGLQLSLTNQDQLNFNIAVVEGIEVASRYVDSILDSLKQQPNIPDAVLIDSKTVIPGTNGVLFPERYRGLTIERAKIAMPYDKIYDSNGKAINGGVNTTDAQAWITPDRWEFLMRKLGKWSPAHDVVSSRMRKGQPLSTDQMKIAAQPLKGVYFNLENGMPVYLKYSQAVLIPALVKNTPMQRLYDKMTIDPETGIPWSKLKDDKGRSMRSSQIHEVITVDGVKVGAMGITKIHDGDSSDLAMDFELNSYPLSNRGWKLQQDLPNKQMHETLIGSQLQKNILAGMVMDGDYNIEGEDKPVNGRELLARIHKTVSGLSNMGKEDISEKLGITPDGVITNTDRLYDALIEEFKTKDGSRNIVTALEKKMPLDAIPQAREKVQSIFMSMMNKAMIKVTTNGGSFIQVSPFGIETMIKSKKDSKQSIMIVSDNYDGKGLKPPRIENGKFMPGQAFVPHSAIVSILEKHNRSVPREERISLSKLTKAQLKKLIDPSALELISYRIPNQGMSSNDMIEIVGILPEGMGDAIVAYDGVPAKTGSDFDIDKMFVMMHNLEYVNGKIQKVRRDRGYTHQDVLDKIEAGREKELEEITKAVKESNEIEADSNEEYEEKLALELEKQERRINRKYNKMVKEEKERESSLERNLLENELIELYKSVLSSPHTYDAMMTSIDASFFKDDILKLFPPKKHGNLSMFNPVEQVKIKFEYMSGKFGVAQTANQLVDHNLSQSTPLTYKKNKTLGIGNQIDYGGIQFDEIYDQDNKHRISDVLSAFLNAYVDIAKDPYISRGNHNTVTANTVFMLLRAGAPVEWVNRFVGQPIIKELVEITKTSKSVTAEPLKNSEGQVVNPYNYLRDKYGREKERKVKLKEIRERFPESKLEKNISDGVEIAEMSREDINEQFRILDLFEEYTKMSKDLSLTVQASKADTKGGGGSFRTLFIRQNTKMQVHLDNVFNGFDEKFKETMLGTYHENSVTWVEDLVNKSDLFLTGKKNVKMLYNDISESLGKGLLTDEDLSRELEKSLYSYLMSDFRMFKNNTSSKENVNKLFIGLAKRVEKLKKTERNFLLSELEVKYDGGYTFIGINSKNKPTTYKDSIYRDWVNLLRSDDPELRSVGMDLVKYAYASSGFQNNLSQFFSNIPHEILASNEIDLFIKKLFVDIDQGIHMDEHFKDQMFRHNSANDVLVPVVNLGKNGYKLKGMKNFFGGFIYDPSTSSNPLEFTSLDGEIHFPKFIKSSKGKEGVLYELIGTITKEVTNPISGIKTPKKFPVYKKTHKLGFDGKKGKIFEYNYKQPSENSSIPKNNLDEKIINARKEFIELVKKDDTFLSLEDQRRVYDDIGPETSFDIQAREEVIRSNFNEILKDKNIKEDC